jgi:hypothetical protein
MRKIHGEEKSGGLCGKTVALARYFFPLFRTAAHDYLRFRTLDCSAHDGLPDLAVVAFAE